MMIAGYCSISDIRAANAKSTALVLLPDLFCDERDSIADDIQVVELAHTTGVSLLREMGSSLMTRSQIDQHRTVAEGLGCARAE